MKKLINETGAIVDDMLLGLVRARPGLALLEGERVVLREDAKALAAAGKVALISGGGSGHEPAHAGYVGPGMLTAAVCGEVFTSPSTDAVLAAIRAVAGPAGVLLIVKNYTGDRLNFGLAAEIARAEGLSVEMAVVADDVALAAKDADETAGRRGIAGTVLIHKLLGAGAEAGADLAALQALATQANGSLATMGVALGTCTVPAAGKPNFTLGADEVEYGLGIHGEAGVRRGPLAPVRELISVLGAEVFARFAPGSSIALLVNDLGATPPMELAITTGEALALAESAGLQVARIFSGRYLTALEMPGVSISAMQVSEAELALLDAPSPVWPAGCAPQPLRVVARPAEAPIAFGAAEPLPPVQLAAIRRALEALIAAEDHLTELDRQVGDGDIGINLARGARDLIAALPALGAVSLADLIGEFGRRARASVGGTSGALYGVGLLRAAATLREGKDLTQALAAATDAISTLGGAKAGDRTMLDALLPVVASLTRGDSLPEAIAAAEANVAAVSQSVARRGRASYLGDRAIGHPDPGAIAVITWLTAIAAAKA